ncbi:MAG: carboxyl-terminal processing protease CtpB [Microcoleaceae cyanobacterium]
MTHDTKHFSQFQTTLFTGALAAVSALAIPVVIHPVSAALQDNPKAIVDEAWQIVNQEYVDPTFNDTDWQSVRQELLSKEYISQEQAYSALRDALEQLDDPYTRFMNPKQYERLLEQVSGELSGVGMRLKLDEDTQAVTVVEPIKGAPAISAGIQTGDTILAIDGQSTEGMTVEEAAKRIRGPVGSQVNLQVGRTGQDDFNVSLTRARIEIEAVTSRINEEGGRRIGYVQLREFNSHASEQMEAAIKDLNDQSVDAFVLDLRGNPGGLLRSSLEIARMWLDTGGIVSTVSRDGGVQEERATRTALTQSPVVVLVDEDSASASEILAGAMKDNKRAIVMGDQTFGKALVQSVFPLSDGSGLAVTIAHYYTPNGTDISKKGVTPDVKLELTDSEKKELASNPDRWGTSADPYYLRAVDLLLADHGTRPIAVSGQR